MEFNQVEEWEKKRMAELAQRCWQQQRITASEFLDPAGGLRAVRLAGVWGSQPASGGTDQAFFLWGGYPGAERQRLFWLPKRMMEKRQQQRHNRQAWGAGSQEEETWGEGAWGEKAWDEEAETEEAWSEGARAEEAWTEEEAAQGYSWAEVAQWTKPYLCCLEITGGKPGLSHRDYLGALMHLGIERRVLGDICLCPAGALLWADREIMPYLLNNLERVGKSSVQVNEVGENKRHKISQEINYIKVNVPSFRLDCLVAEIFRLSRSKAAEAIRQGLVSVNWQAEVRGDKELKVGDVITLSGSGRAKIEEVGGISKKGRLFVKIGRPG